MNHWLFLPVLLPLLCGALLVLLSPGSIRLQRRLALGATAALTPVAVVLFGAALDGAYLSYTLGDWPAPFGIVLVLDRLSALMLLLTALVALASLSYALMTRVDRQGRYFHALLQFQLLGLNGAFLTGDLFNLFVSFEILLIASYGLLLHGGGAQRVRAGLHYVVLNLTGSALFLLGIGVLYGVTGTLNMADLALKLSLIAPQQAALVRAGALLLFVVFALKAALLPLYFWLPPAYSAASAPVAALFAIMTKVGVYAIVRAFTLMFGPAAGITATVVQPWILALALATLLGGSLGALASRNLATLLAYLVVVSVGTLLTPIGLFSEAGLSAGLLYLIHTTLITAAMFILADVIACQRTSGKLQPAAPLSQPLLLGTLFFTGAVALAGLPPLSGFLAKLMILQALYESPGAAWGWGVLLLASLFALIALSRTGSALFWKTDPSYRIDAGITRPHLALPAVALLATSPLLMVFAEPITAFTRATARQLGEPAAYIEQVLSQSYRDSVYRQRERSQ